MSGFREYLFQIITAAVLVSILSSFFHKKGSVGSVMSVICGLALAISAFKPLLNIRMTDFSYSFYDKSGVEAAVAGGEEQADRVYRQYIQKNTEAYILNKAEELGAELTVTVALSQDPAAKPERITLSGAVSPYGKNVLKKYIFENIGIDEEHQIWN